MLQAASSPAAWLARRLIKDRFRGLNDKQWRSVRVRFASQRASVQFEVSASRKVPEGFEQVVKSRNVVQQLEEAGKIDENAGRNIEVVKKFATRAPRYSKAARRYYNEKFRTEKERLSKVLAAAGVASRRACEEVIFAGKVTVNGKICKVPETHVDPLRDIIYIAGKSLPRRLPPKMVFALYKPKGYICSDAVDEKKSVSLLLEPFLKTWTQQNPGIARPRLFNIGRLDVGTTGLLLLTNDGQFANKVAHPSSGITKEYVVTVGDKVTKRQIQKVAGGTTVDGVECIPVAVELLTPQAGGTHQRLRVVVSEGRNHEVRHLVENAHLKVHALKRIRVGGFRLPASLSIGKFIQLTEAQAKKVLEEDPVLLARAKSAAAIESQEQQQVKMISKPETPCSSVVQVEQQQAEQQLKSDSQQQQQLEDGHHGMATVAKDDTTKPKKKKDRILFIPTKAQGPVFIPRRGRENQRTRFLERA